MSFKNDGPGISCEKMETKDGREMYIPQMVATEPFCGDNMEVDPNKISGGTNGLGLKLVNAYSYYMQIETYDSKTGIEYKQIYNSLYPPIPS